MKQYLTYASWYFICVLIVSCNTSGRGRSGAAFNVKLNSKDQLLSGRLFPVFTKANEQRGGGLLHDNAEFESLARSISSRYKAAIRDCEDLSCLANGFKITENEKQAVLAAVTNGGVGGTSVQSKIGSLTYNGSAMEAIGNEMNSINYILDVYLGGENPRYPKIDKASRLNDKPKYLSELRKATEQIYSKAGASGSFYHLPWLTALKVLALNGRDEAGRYEPMTTLNKAAFKKVKAVEWDKYKYSAILVPGLGPQKAGLALDPGGAKRCDLAASRYKKGIAPFIIVSGGHVHPDKTPYNEAIEMRKYLVEKLRIPAYAVIAEPYARHTTTNIRNAARLVFQLGLPEKLPVLIVTDIGQATYIMFMKGRFQDELG